MAEDEETLDSWEELEDEKILDKKLGEIKVSSKKEQTVSQPGTLREEGNRTQYQPQVRILKRQTDAADDSNKNKAKENKPTKTLKQREAEYREARERILGVDYTTEEPTNNTSSEESSGEPRPVKLAQHAVEARLEAGKPVKVVREPKGPDGTPGFSQQR